MWHTGSQAQPMSIKSKQSTHIGIDSERDKKIHTFHGTLKDHTEQCDGEIHNWHQNIMLKPCHVVERERERETMTHTHTQDTRLQVISKGENESESED